MEFFRVQRVYHNFTSLLFCIYLFLILGKINLMWTGHAVTVAFAYKGKKGIKAILGKREEKRWQNILTSIRNSKSILIRNFRC